MLFQCNDPSALSEGDVAGMQNRIRPQSSFKSPESQALLQFEGDSRQAAPGKGDAATTTAPMLAPLARHHP